LKCWVDVNVTCLGADAGRSVVEALQPHPCDVNPAAGS
jgi:hypothetical protein